jgi:hypothetical protein
MYVCAQEFPNDNNQGDCLLTHWGLTFILNNSQIVNFLHAVHSHSHKFFQSFLG